MQEAKKINYLNSSKTFTNAYIELKRQNDEISK
jgi:hypothetical protein